MNRTVKGMIAVGLSLSVLTGGGLAYQQYDKTIKTINRLEQKVKGQDAEINLLQNNTIRLERLNENLIDSNYGLVDDNKEIKIQNIKLQKENDRIKKEIEYVKKNYINVEASAYIATCSEGCTGKTFTGIDVRRSVYYKGYRVVAVDPNVIPLNSILELHFKDGTKMKAIAIDTGGGINNYEIDLLVSSEKEAKKFGRQDVTIFVVKRG